MGHLQVKIMLHSKYTENHLNLEKNILRIFFETFSYRRQYNTTQRNV